MKVHIFPELGDKPKTFRRKSERKKKRRKFKLFTRKNTKPFFLCVCKNKCEGLKYRFIRICQHLQKLKIFDDNSKESFASCKT